MSSQSTGMAKPQKAAHWLVGGRTYHVSNLVAWSLYGLLQYEVPPEPRGLPVAMGAIAWCGTGLLVVATGASSSDHHEARSRSGRAYAGPCAGGRVARSRGSEVSDRL
jgi:hypothetical protein